MAWKKGGNKYGNSKIIHQGHSFDSRAEASLFDLLSLRERSGEISDLKPHPGTLFLTEARIQYRPDFSFLCCITNKTIFAEYKGFADQKWPLKKKLWKFYGFGKLEIWKMERRSLKLIETITPKKR